MPVNPNDAPPGFRVAPSDGNCRCAETLVRCAFNERGACMIPMEYMRRGLDGIRRAPCYEPVRDDGVLAVFLKDDRIYGNEEDA